ncbi:DUF6385 domain-containing protein [Bacillus sp. FJAT-45350]|uniref:DUF6385 domain-containing protein n=1 Tax=Bacillus sp. FJAT-45350 TaxID=2011014 RepID=UPI000BB92978|nr:DUF6385 domain-containing protein [Bacillus sp. FJAT-45350]
MPNFSTFNLDADQLRSSIFGTDATGDVLAVRTDDQGRLDIVGDITVQTIEAIMGATVTTIEGGTLNKVETIDAVMGATITAGTLNKVETIDAVMGATITAGTLNKVETIDAVMGATITAGILNTVETVNEVTTVVAISQQNFVEDDLQNQTLPAAQTDTEVPEDQLRRDTQFFKVYTYFITNHATTDTLDVKIQVSPDNNFWFDDIAATGIVDETVALVPKRFGKYTRLVYSTVGEVATVDFWFNAQG